MKKVISILLAVLCLATVLTGCTGDPLVGTWTTTIDGDEGQMILEADGVGTIISNGIDRPCKWEAADGVLTVVQEVDGYPFVFLDEVTYQIEGKTLTVTSQSGNTLVFKKE